MSLKEQAGVVEKDIPVFNSGALIGRVFISFDMCMGPDDSAVIAVKGMVEDVYEGVDFYDVFMTLRKFLEDRYEAILGCQGCLKQAHLSGLSKDWSNGLTGYITDEKTLSNDSIFIFDEIVPDQVGDLMTINDQRAYRENFRRENKARYIERNKRAEIAAKARDREDKKNGNSWRS